MTRDLFCKIGAALYGPRWHSEMARELGVAYKTVQRWAAGERPIPDSAVVLCDRAVSDRLHKLNGLSNAIWP